MAHAEAGETELGYDQPVVQVGVTQQTKPIDTTTPIRVKDEVNGSAAFNSGHPRMVQLRHYSIECRPNSDLIDLPMKSRDGEGHENAEDDQCDENLDEGEPSSP